jgi:F-type H+-transporting ATPase subunit gamma
LLVVCTAERGLCGAFNSSIVRLARERANQLMGEGKTVKFLCVGRKGFEQLRRNYEKQIIEVIELRGVRNVGFVNAEASRSGSSRCSTRARSTSRRCSSRASGR